MVLKAERKVLPWESPGPLPADFSVLPVSRLLPEVSIQKHSQPSLLPCLISPSPPCDPLSAEVSISSFAGYLSELDAFPCASLKMRSVNEHIHAYPVRALKWYKGDFPACSNRFTGLSAHTLSSSSVHTCTLTRTHQLCFLHCFSRAYWNLTSY